MSLMFQWPGVGTGSLTIGTSITAGRRRPIADLRAAVSSPGSATR